MTLLDDLAIIHTVAARYEDDWCTCPEPEWWFDGRHSRCEACDRFQSPGDAEREMEDAMAERADDTVEAGRG